MKQVFVYGTLKRGGSNHHFLEGQRFVTEAQTKPLFALYDLGGYPGLVRTLEAPESVMGELWEVDELALSRLDVLEGLEAGEYRRVPIPLAPPHEDREVEGYEYLLDVAHARRLCGVWTGA